MYSISWRHCLLWYCWLSIEMTMPTIDWNENFDYRLKISADYLIDWNNDETKKANYRLKWKKANIDWKWNCRSCLCDYPIICLSIGLLIGMKNANYQLEMKGLVERPCDQRVCWKCCTLSELRDSASWSAFCAAKDIENIVPVYLTIWLSNEKCRLSIEEKCRSCLPFKF